MFSSWLEHLQKRKELEKKIAFEYQRRKLCAWEMEQVTMQFFKIIAFIICFCLKNNSIIILSFLFFFLLILLWHFVGWLRENVLERDSLILGRFFFFTKKAHGLHLLPEQRFVLQLECHHCEDPLSSPLTMDRHRGLFCKEKHKKINLD